MADDETKESTGEQQDEDEGAEHLQPGVLSPFDYSPNDPLEFTSDEQQKLTSLVEKYAKRDMAARRFEVEQTWEARLFDRGYQYLLPRRKGGWEFPDDKTGYAGLNANMLGTNIYSPYGQIICSALTRSIPKVRFQANDPEKNKDVTAADAADDYKKSFSLVNDLQSLHSDAARYLWNDGRCAFYTRHVKDAQRFGYEENEDDAVVPETETPQPNSDQGGLPQEGNNGVSVQPETGEGNPSQTETPGEATPQAGIRQSRTPAGEEVTDVYGKLEVKLPMNTRSLSDCHFLKLSLEYDIARAKAMFPEISKKITPSSGPGENELDRIARINCALALAGSYVTGDAMVSDCTVDRTWIRPAAYMDIADEDLKNRLFDEAPEGLLIVHAGKEFAWAREECIDDHWALAYATRNDGQNCAALGSWLIPIQKRYNNWRDLQNDYFIRCIPRIYLPTPQFNVEALKQQTQVPGDFTPYLDQAGVDMRTKIFVEETPQPNPQLAEVLQEYSGPVSQLATGGYPALQGNPETGTDTLGGIAIQRDQAMGRLGIAWHSIQYATADYNRQSVQCAAKCREGSKIKKSVPGSDALIIELEDLKGNVLCHPEADSGFPESWGEKQARFTAFMDGASKNPLVQLLLQVPANQKVVKDMVGMTDLKIPQADSYDKQNGELELLLKSGPQPNPQIQKLTQIAQDAADDPELLTDPKKQQAAMQAAQMAKQLQQTTPLVSTVPIDPVWDDHDAEAMAIAEFVNSPKGRKMAHGTQEEKDAIANIKLHGQEHKQAGAKQKAEQQQAAQKQKVSESINFKDLPDSGKVQMASQAGIQINPAELMPTGALANGSNGQVPPA